MTNSRFINKVLLRVVFFIFLCSFPLSAYSTVNIETMRDGEGEKDFKSSLSYSFYEATGNTEIKSHKTSARTDYQGDKFHTFLALSQKRGKKDDSVYMDKGFAHLRFMVPLTNRFTSEFFTQKEYNDFTLLLDRSLGGVGIRTLVLNKKDSYDVYLGVGVMKEKEVIDLTEEVTTKVTRLTNYLSMKFKLNDTVSFTGTGYYQPRSSKTKDYRILFDGELLFKITKRLNFALEVNHRRDSMPPLGVQKSDREIMNSLKFIF